jgi:hypothetical protein
MGITYTPTRLKPISKALLLSSTLAGVLLFAVVSPASAAPACWKTLINDWYDGRIDNVYPVDCYQQALKHLPEDVQTYSSARDDIRAALASRLVTKRNGKGTAVVPAGPGKNDGGPKSGGGTKGRDGGGGPVQKVADTVGPKDATSFPIPLMVLGGVALLLLAAGTAGFAARRVQARRVIVQPSQPPHSTEE